MSRRATLRSLLVCSGAAAWVLWPWSTWAASATALNIPAQPLAEALRELSRQSGVNILFRPETAVGLRAPIVRGVMTAEEAARRLVAGKGLDVVRDSTGSMIVRDGTPPIRAQVRSRPAGDESARPPPVSSSFQEAQAAKPPAPTWLEEIVVTATRQTDTVNRVPLSIQALTQRTLLEQGLKAAPDLVQTVPGLNAAGALNGVAIFSIRGVVANVGAATTGVYIDDTSLTKRANAGILQFNGSPAPLLFDLERVEVLKGPQGTLYGGSSEGGTIRYITPAPSLVQRTASILLEGSHMKNGAAGYDLGLSIGGPIVKDKLAFRGSAITRKTPGNIDVYSAFDNSRLATNVNGRKDYAVRGSLLWQVTDRASAQLSVYSTHGETKGEPRYYNATVVYGPDAKKAPQNQTYTTPQLCFDTGNLVVTRRPPVAQTPCPVGGAPAPANVFMRPSYTYGPFRQLTKDEAFATVGQSRVTGLGPKNDFDVGSLTLDYKLDAVNVRVITSYTQDGVRFYNSGGEDPSNSQSTLEDPAHQSFPLFSLAGAASGLMGDYTGGQKGRNRRYTTQHELRFSSPDDKRPFSWVGGIYYSNARTHILFSYLGNGDRLSLAYWGVTADQRYGVVNTAGVQAVQDAQMHDNEVAAFGDANYWITPKLKATAGIRFSRVQLDYFQRAWGQFDQRGPYDAQSITAGTATAAPVTPKFGVQYQISNDDMAYINVAKGFRAGGVNPQVSEAFCSAGLELAGIRSDQVPPTYGPDTVWSYEAGGKFRLLNNRMQLNTAVFRIDWTGVQATIPLSCGFNFVMNGGHARSEGFELQAQYRPWRRLTLTANLGYTNARNLDGVAGPNPQAKALPSVNPGDGFSIPKWQVSASALYERAVTHALTGYARLDAQRQSGYTNGTSYGTASYNYFTREVGPQTRFNLRIGGRFGDFDVNLFANNLFNARAKVGNGGVGRVGCGLSETCTSYAIFNPFVQQAYQPPRVVGAQVNYRLQ
jgi:outer membrane receptor protein involved in Fe transport